MNADMSSLETGPRGAALMLLSLLDDMASELECLLAEGDTGWLKPLLVLHAEIYFTARRSSGVDVAALADERRELATLLTCTSSSNDEFAHRYANARRASPRLRQLHAHVVDACRARIERPEAA